MGINEVTLQHKLSGTTAWTLAEVIALSSLTGIAFLPMSYAAYTLAADHIAAKHPAIADIIHDSGNIVWDAENSLTKILDHLAGENKDS